jgi:hypothetical protein
MVFKNSLEEKKDREFKKARKIGFKFYEKMQDENAEDDFPGIDTRRSFIRRQEVLDEIKKSGEDINQENLIKKPIGFQFVDDFEQLIMMIADNSNVEEVKSFALETLKKSTEKLIERYKKNGYYWELIKLKGSLKKLETCEEIKEITKIMDDAIEESALKWIDRCVENRNIEGLKPLFDEDEVAENIRDKAKIEFIKMLGDKIMNKKD